MMKTKSQLPIVEHTNDCDDGKNKSFRRNPMATDNPQLSLKNQFVLLLSACLWPLAVLALFAASAPGQHNHIDVNLSPGSLSQQQQQRQSQQRRHKNQQLMMEPGAKNDSSKGGFNIRNVLDRIDVMGFGPTHPRVAFVVVGENRNSLIESIESIFASTDMKRIFIICAVLDGRDVDEKLVKKLHKIERGIVPHWHGSKNEVHRGGEKRNRGDEVDDKEKGNAHSPKIHVLFNPKRIGLAASRSRATNFVQILARKHESNGMKSSDEDLILMLLQGGSKFKDNSWLNEVTPALIVPPPLISLRNEDVVMKLANAISFHVEGAGKRTSFDKHFARIVSDATASEINQSSGRSFSTPALNGDAIAMRLNTYRNLPHLDTSMMDNWSSNLDLSLNLWLCADGIDVVDALEIIPPSKEIHANTPKQREQVARFAAIYMDEIFVQKYLQSAFSMDTKLDRETMITRIRCLSSITQSLFKKCRSFEWYIEEVNTDLSGILDAIKRRIDQDDVHNSPKPVPNTVAEEKKATKISDVEKESVDSPKIEAHIEAPELEKQIDASIEPPSLLEDDSSVKKKPSKPLRSFNLGIVQKLEMIDTSFVDVSDGHQEHPHLGGLDSNNAPGYVLDETALRKNPPLFTYDYKEMKKACSIRDDNYRMMKERIVVETDYNKLMEKSGKKRDKLFCLVYTTESGHSKIPFIRETWGPRCDGFMVGSNKTDEKIGAVNIPHEGPEEYNNIWQKVRSMWSYIYDNYYEKYDWFHIGGDDLFLIVENLRYYLESEEIQTASNGGIYLPDNDSSNRSETPLFLGRRFAYQGNMDNIFNSGGSGYTINKAALKLLVTEGFPNYFPHAHTFSEDTMVAKIFHKMGVLPYDTKDDEGGERYMPFLPGHHYSYRLPSDVNKDWYAKYSIDIKEGPEHCSPKSIAFHYAKTDMMKRLHALAYGLCSKS